MTEPETTEQPEQDQAPDREAAKYRTQLRAAESERDALRGQVRAMQRAELERVATSGDGPRLHKASDLWPDDDTTNLEDLVDEHGRIDSDAVHAVIEAATMDRAYLRADRAQRRSDPSQGHGNEREPAGASWAEVLRGE